MNQWGKFVVIEHIIAKVVVFAGVQGDFSIWANENVCTSSEGDDPNLLVIYHAGEEDNTPVPGNEETDPGAFTFGQPDEFLLMKLVLCPPPLDPDDDEQDEQKVSLTVKSGDVTLLDENLNELPSLAFSLDQIPSEGKPIVVKANTASDHGQDIEICANYRTDCEDTVNATAGVVDLDIDSDNDNGFDEPEQDDEEDRIEYSEFDATRPGKIIAVADSGQAGENPDFTPLVFKVPEGLDEAIVKFTYSAADPTSVTGSGHLRIWMEDGQFVQSGAEYPISDLGFAPKIILYVEGIQETSLNEQRKIHLGLDPNGGDEEPGFIGEDLVMVTVIRVDVDIIHQETGEALDEESEDNPGKVIAVNFDDDDCDDKGYEHGEIDVSSDKDDLNGIVKSAESAAECTLDNLDGDDDLVPLKIRQLDTFADYVDLTADFVLDFEDQHIALWQHQEKCAPEDIAYEACADDKVISWRENPDQATRFPVSEETTLWVEGLSPHGNIDGTLITLTLFVNDEEIGKDSVKVIVADPIFVVEGIGSMDIQSPISVRLQDKIIEKRPPLYIVKGGNDVYYSLAFYETEDMLKRAIATEGSIVMYNGHSNYGIGPAFSEDLTRIAEFMNIGRTDPEPANPDTGSFTGIDWNYLRAHAHPTLEVHDDEIPVSPVNYQHPFLPNRLRFENNNGIGAEEHFSLQGEGYNRHHYTAESANEPRLIVKTGNDDVPSLRYRLLFMRSCSSGDYYLETFQHGVFFYTVYPVLVLSEAPLAFIERVVEGDSWDQIQDVLNAPNIEEHPSYEYRIFGK